MPVQTGYQGQWPYHRRLCGSRSSDGGGGCRGLLLLAQTLFQSLCPAFPLFRTQTAGIASDTARTGTAFASTLNLNCFGASAGKALLHLIRIGRLTEGKRSPAGQT